MLVQETIEEAAAVVESTRAGMKLLDN